MVDSGNALLNDGALIQIRRDKVSSGTNDLDAALVSLMVGFGAFEGRQEAVVDVDDAAGHGFAQLGGQNLHVAGEDDELDLVLGNEIEDLGFLLGLGVLGDGEVMEGDVVRFGERLEFGVVGYNEGDLKSWPLVHCNAFLTQWLLM